MNKRILGLVGSMALVGPGMLGITSTFGLSAMAATSPTPCVATFNPNPVYIGDISTFSVTGFLPNEPVTQTSDAPGSVVVNTSADATGTYASEVGDPFIYDGDFPVPPGTTITLTYTGGTSGSTCTGTVSFQGTRSTTDTTSTTTSSTTTTSTTVVPSTVVPAATAAVPVQALPAYTG